MNGICGGAGFARTPTYTPPYFLRVLFSEHSPHVQKFNEAWSNGLFAFTLHKKGQLSAVRSWVMTGSLLDNGRVGAEFSEWSPEGDVCI